jgi:hypothetical protein
MEAMTSKPSDQEALLRLAIALAEDVLSASDEEIVAEAVDDGIGVDSAADAGRAKFEEVVKASGRSRLAAAKAAVSAQRPSAKVIKLDPVSARQRLERFLARDPETARKVTLAARKGEGLSDSDVMGILQDLEELGVDVDADKE